MTALAKMWNNRQIQANFTVFLHGDREKFEVVIMASKSMQVFTGEHVFDITFRSILFSEQVKIMATSANKPIFCAHFVQVYQVFIDVHCSYVCYDCTTGLTKSFDRLSP